jgi:hypothetical protein
MSSHFYYHLACFNLIKSNYKRLKLEIWLLFFDNVLRYGKITWWLCGTQKTSSSLPCQGDNVQMSLVVDIPLNPPRGTTSHLKVLVWTLGFQLTWDKNQIEFLLTLHKLWVVYSHKFVLWVFLVVNNGDRPNCDQM